jgi:hypothetical protein
MMLRPVKALLSALAASACLSACVAVDHQASLSQTPRSAEGSLVPTAFSEAVSTPPQRTAMPGDLLLDPEKTERGIDPVAILMRPPTHMTASAARTPTLAARFEPSPPRPLRGMATLPAASSTLAAATAVADASGETDSGLPAAMRARLAQPTLTPLGDVEARALAEQKAQDIRDKRFDRQVRHASSIVCSGCVTAPGRPRSTAQGEAQE